MVVSLCKRLSILPYFLWKCTCIYPIKHQIVSQATRVIFTSTSSPVIPLCLKMWQPCNNGVYITENSEKANTLDLKKCRDYLIEGWNFNRRFAANVYLGFFPVLGEDDHNDWIKCGSLIKTPAKLKPDEHYVLVMKALRQNWRLDHHLCSNSFHGPEGIKFLAQKVAHMHKQLKCSGKNTGGPEQIRAKLELNLQQFDQALKKCATGSACYQSISVSMKGAYDVCEPYFEQRRKDGYIKRCHGDLKAVNLWLCPKRGLAFPRKSPNMHSWQLIALDCVDFNEDFCHIDTLSDIAMLAMDLEMRLTQRLGQQCGKRLVGTFLDTYLREVKDTSELARLLLEYYIIEKAIVCAYMSILYDGLPSLGNKYLAIALAHTKKLEAKLKLVNQVRAKEGKSVVTAVKPLKEARSSIYILV